MPQLLFNSRDQIQSPSTVLTLFFSLHVNRLSIFSNNTLQSPRLITLILQQMSGDLYSLVLRDLRVTKLKHMKSLGLICHIVLWFLDLGGYWRHITKKQKTKKNPKQNNWTCYFSFYDWVKRKLDMLPSQTAYPAGFKKSTPDWPQFPCVSRKCDASVWITWIHNLVT